MKGGQICVGEATTQPNIPLMAASDFKCTGYSTIKTVLASSLKSEIGSNKSEAETWLE